MKLHARHSDTSCVTVFALAVVLACAALAGLAGCQTQFVHPDGSPVSSSEAALIRANDSVTAAYSVIGDARDAGVITQADVDQYASAVKAVDAALDSAGAALRAGDAEGVKRWTDAARAALMQLQPLLTKAKR